MTQKITDNYRVLTPAYGRDYKSIKEVRETFLSGKDFYLEPQHILCSVRDFATGVKVNIRYKKLTMVTVVTIPPPSTTTEVKISPQIPGMTIGDVLRHKHGK